MPGPTCIFWANLTPFSLQANASLARSHVAKPNPHAARGLALLAPSAEKAWSWYQAAWAAMSVWPAADPLREAVADSLAREICEFTRSTGMLEQGAAFAKALPPKLQAKDPAQYAIAAFAMFVAPPLDSNGVEGNRNATANGKKAPDWKTAMTVIARQCWPTYVGSGHQGLLLTLWQQAAYARYAEELGVAVADLDGQQGQLAELKYPPPRNVGGIGTGLDPVQ